MYNENNRKQIQSALNAAAQSPARVTIDLNALEDNYNYLRKSSGQALMPVIKSDAYGHGLLPCAKRLSAAGAEWFAVGTVGEGAMLRENGLKQRVTALLGCLTPSDIDLALTREIIPLAGSFEQLEAISARAGKNTIPTALKFNTGMNRLGFSLSDLGELLNCLAQSPAIIPALAVSHLASADEDSGIAQTDTQIQIFQKIVEELRRHYPKIGTSLYNTAGLLAHAHKFKTDLARPGLALYGANPLSGTGLNRPEIDISLKPVMQVWAPVVQKRLLPKGESISYGAAFTAKQDTWTAIIASGYSQGFSRGLSGRADVNIHGQRCPLLGRVCMQLAAVDVSGLSTISEGDRAWLLGGPGARPITPGELAAWWGTIPYEVFCMLGAVNTREYL